MALIDELERAGVARRGPGGIQVASINDAHRMLDTPVGEIIKRENPGIAWMVPDALGKMPLREALKSPTWGGTVKQAMEASPRFSQQLKDWGVTPQAFAQAINEPPPKAAPAPQQASPQAPAPAAPAPAPAAAAAKPEGKQTLWQDVGKRMYKDAEKAFVDPKTGKLASPDAPAPAEVRSGVTANPPRPPADVPTGGRQPRGIRNNNPLNLEASPWTQKQGGYQGSDGRFGKFATMQEGANAAGNLLQNYANRGHDTVNKIIGKWSPVSDPTNKPGSTSAYAKRVAKELGVDPNAKLDLSNPDTKQRLVVAMAEVESPGSSRAFTSEMRNQAPAQKAINQAIAPKGAGGRGVDIPDRPGSSPRVPQQNAPASPAAAPEQLDWFKRNAYLQKDRDTNTYLNPELARRAGATDVPPSIAQSLSEAVKTPVPRPRPAGADAPLPRPRPEMGASSFDEAGFLPERGQEQRFRPMPTDTDVTPGRVAGPATLDTFSITPARPTQPSPLMALPGPAATTPPPPQATTSMPSIIAPAQAAPVQTFVPPRMETPPMWQMPQANNWMGAGGGWGGGWGTGGFGVPWAQGPFDFTGGGFGGLGSIGSIGFGGM